MTTKEFKEGTLIFSGNAQNKQELEQKINDKIYYGSNNSLTMFELNRGIKWFYLVSSKGIQQNKIVRLDSKGKFQYRYFI